MDNYSSKPIGRNALNRLEQPALPKPNPRPDWNQLQARTTRILDSLASAKGLPSYEQFHQQHGVVYHPPASKSGHGAQTYLKVQSARQSDGFIRETNPEPVPKPQAPRGLP